MSASLKKLLGGSAARPIGSHVWFPDVNNSAVNPLYDTGNAVYLRSGNVITNEEATYPEAFDKFGVTGNNYDTFVRIAISTVWTNQLVFGNGLFIAAGQNGKIHTSHDGITWTERNAGFGNVAINALAYGGGLYVAGGYGGKLATSPDGIVWTQRNVGFGTSTIISALVYGGGLYVATGNDGKLATSPDGLVWTQRDAGFGTTSGIFNLAYSGDLYVASGGNGKLATSPDGIIWTQRASGMSSSGTSIAYKDGLFLAAWSPGVLTGSDDGVNWMTIDQNLGSSSFGGPYLTHDGERWIAVFYPPSGGASLYTSYDAVKWDATLVGSGLDAKSVCFGAGVLILGLFDDAVAVFLPTALLGTGEELQGDAVKYMRIK